MYVAIFIVSLYGGKVACCCMHARPSCQFLFGLLHMLFLTGYQVGETLVPQDSTWFFTWA